MCEVDDVEWVHCFTRHMPGKACLISLRPPQPRGLPRHAQWRGRQGPYGGSQGSSRTSGGRPQPHTQGGAPHTNPPLSSTPNGFPAERSTNKYMQCHLTNIETYDLRKGQLSLGDFGSTLHNMCHSGDVCPRAHLGEARGIVVDRCCRRFRRHRCREDFPRNVKPRCRHHPKPRRGAHRCRHR